MKHFKKLVSATLAVLMASSCASAALVTVDAASNDTLNSHYATNPSGAVGKKKTITVDGNISDWDSSMLIAQGAANDDPRVYRDSSMHEIAMDDYALYACWDDSNLYLMWEMTNVQDVVGGPDDTFPLSQGNIWIYDMPYYLAFDIDSKTGGNGTFTNNDTLWGSGITYETGVDVLMANSANFWNGPYIYKTNSNGLFDYGTAQNINSTAKLKWGNGLVSKDVYGIDGGYGRYHNRLVGDMCGDDADWVEFNSLGHNSDKYDMHWELSIPLSSLGVTSSYIENNGIGVCKVSSFGTSGMDCLPYDVSMNDNANKEYSKEPSGSHEKEDKDHITASFARIGKLSGNTPQPNTTQPNTTQPNTTQPNTTQPNTTLATTTKPVVSTDLIVNATSNLFPAKTLKVNSSEKTVTVKFDLQSAMKLVNGQATLSYDPAVLKLDPAKNADIMPNISNETTHNLTNYTKLLFSDIDNLYDFTTKKNFVSVTFDVLKTGSTTVDLKIDELSVGYMSGGVTNYKNAYVNGQKVDLSVVPGFTSSSLSGTTAITTAVPSTTAQSTTPVSKLTVNSTSNFFPNVTKTYDAATKTVTVSYMLKSNFGVVDSQWTLTYDPTVLSYSSTNKRSTVMPNLNNTLLYKTKDGEVKGNVSDSSLPSDFGEEKVFVTVAFDVIGTGTTEVNLFVDDLSVGYLDENEDLNYAYIVDNKVVTDITNQPGFASASHSAKTVFENSQDHLEGDVNLDGYFNVIDALTILKYCADYITLTPEQLVIADYNNDGRVNVLDVTQIQKKLADLI